MESRSDSRYQHLIKVLMDLFTDECRLECELKTHDSSYVVKLRDTSQEKVMLERIRSAITKIAERHAQLVELVRSKFRLEKCVSITPCGSGGYLKQMKAVLELKKVQDQLDKLVAV